MATAILRAALDRGVVHTAQVVVCDVLPGRRAVMAEMGVAAVADNAEAIRDADTIIAAVKPQDLPGVLGSLHGRINPGQLLVSIAPGITTGQLEHQAGEGIPVVRVMPNTPVLVGEGASGYCRGRHAESTHGERVRRLFESGGKCVEVPEKLMDVVTGLSGSGPAYVCLIVEALADGGVRMGLPRETALTLAAQTVLGAARLLIETGEHPAVWKDRVATPGGTTIAGLAALEMAGVRGGIIQAVEAATRRSSELGQTG
jgi:pyrroline-5-carboxylate reductase